MSSVSREHASFDTPGALADSQHSGTFPQMQTSPVYFNRPDVKQAIHAPADVEWAECADPSVNVFVGPGGADMSPPSAFSVLPSVIEKSARTVIVHGTADFNLIAQG